MRMTSRLAVLILAVTPLLAASPAIAGGYLGGMAGLTMPSGDGAQGVKSRVGFGANAGFQLLGTLDLGAYYLYSKGGTDLTGVDFSTAFYGVETAFHFPVSGLYLGARAGSGSRKVEWNSISATSNPLSVGPRIGFQFGVPAAPIAFGIEYNPMFVMESDPDVAGTSSGNDSFLVHQFFVTARLQF